MTTEKTCPFGEMLTIINRARFMIIDGLNDTGLADDPLIGMVASDALEPIHRLECFCARIHEGK